MQKTEPAWLDIHGAVWESADSYQPVDNATRYELYEISHAAKVLGLVMLSTSFETVDAGDQHVLALSC